MNDESDSGNGKCTAATDPELEADSLDVLVRDGRQRRDLCRQLRYVAEKSAEREFSDCDNPPREHKVVLQSDPHEATGWANVSCNMACESCAEGPAEEQGDRSHANGVRSLLRQLGCTLLEAEVLVRRVRIRPVKYKAAEPKILQLR